MGKNNIDLLNGEKQMHFYTNWKNNKSSERCILNAECMFFIYPEKLLACSSVLDNFIQLIHKNNLILSVT